MTLVKIVVYIQVSGCTSTSASHEPTKHWSHPFPRFSYENSEFRVRFYSDLLYLHALRTSTPTSRGETHNFFLILNKISICTLFLIFNLGLCAYRSCLPHIFRLLIIMIFNGVLLSSLYHLRILLMRILYGILFRSRLEQEVQ